MFRCFVRVLACAASGVLFISSPAIADVSTASSVVTYTPGTITAGYAYPNSNWITGPAIGLPSSTEGGYFGDTSVITPFNAQYNPASLVGLAGSSGYIEFQMSKPVATNGLTLGVHVGAGLNDMSYPNGIADAAGSTYTNARQATVLVSQDGTHWVSLGDTTFSNPTNLYSDASGPYPSAAGSTSANFTKPFTGTLSDFANESFPQVLTTLNGTGGGTWLDLSGTGLSEVDYVAFQTATNETMYVNAITGVAVPEPVGLGAVTAGFILLARRSRSSRSAA